MPVWLSSDGIMVGTSTCWAQRLARFDGRLGVQLFHSPYCYPYLPDSCVAVQAVPMDAVLEHCDHVGLHLRDGRHHGVAATNNGRSNGGFFVRAAACGKSDATDPRANLASREPRSQKSLEPLF